MVLAFIKWKDAMTDPDPHPGPVQAELYPLSEIGYLVAETDEVVTICMELDTATEHPGRFRLHIPRVNIISMKTVEVEKAFNRKAKTII